MDLTALVFFLLAVVSGVSPEVVFTGFTSGGLWLAFSGLVIGIAIRRTGLAARLARAVVGVFGQSYHGLVCGLVLVGTILESAKYRGEPLRVASRRVTLTVWNQLTHCPAFINSVSL